MPPFQSAPEPNSSLEAAQWAAWWAGPVARYMGLVREWRRGDEGVAREIAESLPVVVGLIERNKEG